jgi:hypothetical protein
MRGVSTRFGAILQLEALRMAACHIHGIYERPHEQGARQGERGQRLDRLKVHQACMSVYLSTVK